MWLWFPIYVDLTYVHVVEVVLVLLRALEVGPEGVLVNLGALSQVHPLEKNNFMKMAHMA